MKYPDKISEIKNLCAAELLNRLNLINDENFFKKTTNDYPVTSFNYHLFNIYNSKNDSSHRWINFNQRELFNLRFSISIFYIDIINKLQSLLRKVDCLPNEIVEYYAQYVDKNGIPYGIRKLTKEEVKERESSYKFILKEKKLIKVVHINSLGNLYVSECETFPEPVIQEIDYPDNNTIKIYCKNNTGKKINFIKEYKRDIKTNAFDRLNYYKGDENSSYHLLSDTKSQFSQRLNINSIDSTRANISSEKYFRNTDGFIVKKQFLKYHGENFPQSDKNNNYGYEYELNKDGLIEKEYLLDKTGKRKKFKKDYCC
ncbi:MAG: hypothetical protein HUJ68_05350, partial [Clostridia bacterium]|nr:hypothetical protein [Clostridia bacterium]